MKIRIVYEPNAQELAEASLLFIEKKPLIFYTIGFINVFAYFILFIIIVKAFFLHSLLPNEWMAGMTAGLWVLGRHPFTQWLLLLKMKQSLLLHTPLTIDISTNGIAWSGQRVRTGSVRWDALPYVLETHTGFILPSATSQFLWLPFRGFLPTEESIQTFKQMLVEHNIRLRIV